MLGGVLQTSKTLTADEASSESTSKEKYKVAVGVAVQTVSSHTTFLYIDSHIRPRCV